MIALALLLLIGAVHYAVEPLASQYADPARANRALFYVAQGVKGICLFGLIAYLAPRKLTAAPLHLACLWGIAEDALVSGCRVARGIETSLDLGLWQGVCSGWPTNFIGPVIGALAAGALLWEFDDASRSKSLTDRAKS